MEKRPQPTILAQILAKPKELSPEQKAAVTAEERQVKIIAGAGAGKTETLTRRIAYLLLVQGVKPSEIVAFTFTEKAAQSLKNRIYQRVEQLAGAETAAKLGEMFIGTIHGYSKRLLDDHFGTGKYGILDENQEIAFLMRHGWQLQLLDYGKNYVEGCRNFLRTVTMVWDEMLDRGELEWRAPSFNQRMIKYERLVADHFLLTFGSMIHLAALKLKEQPNVVANVKHLIVDEYQDINKAQVNLIETIGTTASLFVVGDPRQSIYQWRGSNERFFSRFSERYPNAREITITENRRSLKAIVKNANRFAESFEMVNYEPMQATRDQDGFLGLAENHTAEDEAAWVADQIEYLTNSKGLAFSDVGVLMRSVTTSGGPLLDELRRRRVPFIVGGKVGLFRKDESQTLGRLFSWFWEEGFWVEDIWHWSEKTEGDQLLDTALAHWSSVMSDRMPANARDLLIDIKNRLHSGQFKARNFTEIYQHVIIALGFHDLNHEDRNDAAVMANLGRFNELLTDYEIANRLGGRQPQWKRDLKGLCWYMNSYATQAYEEGIPEDTRGVDAVQVLTVHQAKGLEWPVVFVISMSEKRFPSKNVGKHQEWCGVPRELFEVARYEGSLEDERRLLYVAITRARDALVVSHFRKKTNFLLRSAFIDNLDLDSFVTLGGETNLPSIDIDSQSTEDEILTFSAGEIITFDRCPYMYLLSDVWGFQPGLNQALGYGNSLHHCLRRASELVKRDGINPASAVATAVDEDFHMPYASGKVLTDFQNSALDTLVNFADKYSSDFGRIEEVEYRLEFPVFGATIIGRVDVLLRDSGNLEVRDYKTSEEAKTFDETAVQVRLYSLGLIGLGRKITKGSVAYLEEADVRHVPIDTNKLKDARTMAEKCIEDIKSCLFKPKCGQWCGTCDLKPICRWS